MRGRRPDFVIVGAQKAGSTLLHQALRTHPDVYLHEAEDPYFRDPVFRDEDVDAFERTYAGRTERRVGMKCPDYLARPEVPARLRSYLDIPDLVVALRDPLGRALSAYFWWMRWGLIPVRPAEEGLRAALELARRGADDLSVQLLGWGRYGEHVSRYLDHFPRAKLFVALDHEMRRDPAAVVRDVYSFLGVRPDVAAPTVSTRDNPGIYSLDRLRFLQRRNKHILVWDESGTFPAIPKPRGMARAYSDAVAGVDRYLLSRVYPEEKPVLSAGLTADLRDYYRDDVATLESLLGLDLGHWRAMATPTPPAG